MAYVNTIGKSIYEKDQKKAIKEYAMNLEIGISKYKTKLAEIEKDHKQVTESFISEISKSSKYDHAVTVIKRICNKLVGKKGENGLLCQNCCELKELQAL